VLLYEQVGDEHHIIELARSGKWRAVDQHELISTGYPQPRGRLYLVTTLDIVPEPPTWLADITIDVLKPDGVCSWCAVRGDLARPNVERAPGLTHRRNRVA